MGDKDKVILSVWTEHIGVYERVMSLEQARGVMAAWASSVLEDDKITFIGRLNHIDGNLSTVVVRNKEILSMGILSVNQNVN